VWMSNVVFGMVQGAENGGEQRDVWFGTGC
jgi:hypothetical protein